MIAHKFGGSSVANAERIARVVDILLSRSERQVVVVSAMSGVTDALIELVKLAAAKDDRWHGALDTLHARHTTTAQQLLGTKADPVVAMLEREFASLHDLLHAQSLVGAISNDLLDLVSGLGEVWSSTMVDATLRARGAPSVWLDAREVLAVDKTDLGAIVHWDGSQRRVADHLAAMPPRTIVTGFVARTGDGRITTLGRNGSDYSGAIFAALFAAKELHVWSDVDGVLSADPRLVPEAVHIPQLSYSEACELAYFGAKVLHPQTMAPAIERGIPIVARNTFRPEHPGTRISAEVDLTQPVKGVTTFTGLAILDLEGAGMIGVPGTAERVFAALKLARVSVVMISQGSSEHSICCVIRETDADAARHAVREEFARELTSRQVTDISVTRGTAALAIVGDGMAGRPGVASQLFGALARANVNVRLIAQGASERNISVAIDAAQARRALRAVHAAFYLSAQTISIGLVGPGNVGKAFFDQVQRARERLLRSNNLDLRIRAVAGSKRMALAEPFVRDAALPALDRDVDLAAFADHVQAEHLPHAVIVDCSATSAVADLYEGWLARGIHVITPNKQAGSGPWQRYEPLRRQPGQFRYEATVGAGLPILTTLRDLLDTGDEVLAIEGILSGTLAYLLHHFDGSKPFSTLVRAAMERGYTEPDPRDDLSGLDVARKLVILARENGWRIDLEQVHLESLVPPALRAVPLADFLARLHELDAPMAERHRSVGAGRALRYVATLGANGSATVGLVPLPADHALVRIRPTDNVVQFTTKRYRDNPLLVQGPGAGPDVTAMGVFADLLRVATSLGARL
ncbi:MAG: bifunctional aspartate kinase/homoserine dehydrogenase I [Planctomycetes bacterium]|nr:bifunctional aspartate kinase/homoserine dehydrogenase I [Planctomycetota bacterium]